MGAHLVPIRQPIIIGVVIQRIGLGGSHLVPVVYTIIIGVCIRRIGSQILLLLIGQTIAIGVRGLIHTITIVVDAIFQLRSAQIHRGIRVITIIATVDV